MRSRVWASVCCLSVSPIDWPQQWHVAGLLLWALRRQMSIDCGGRWAVVFFMCVCCFLFHIIFIITYVSVILVLTLSLYCALVLAIFFSCLSVRDYNIMQKCPQLILSWPGYDLMVNPVRDTSKCLLIVASRNPTNSSISLNLRGQIRVHL